MSSVTSDTTGADPEAAGDARAVLEHLLHRTPLDPEVYRRIHERAEQVTQRIRQQQGVLSIAVDLIRQARDEG